MPSYQDMKKAIGARSHGGQMARIINQLIDEGKLEREPGVARGLILPGLNLTSFFSAPLLGKISANNRKPIVHLGVYDSDSTIEIPTHLLPASANFSSLYVLQVQGNSMSAARIADKDYVVMERGNTFRDNDIIAILLKDESAVTLKILSKTKRGSAKLKPKSHKHHSRIENREDIEVQGRVVAVMRKYQYN
jgi:SOS-response transcriptional repressor LexA